MTDRPFQWQLNSLSDSKISFVEHFPVTCVVPMYSIIDHPDLYSAKSFPCRVFPKSKHYCYYLLFLQSCLSPSEYFSCKNIFPSHVIPLSKNFFSVEYICTSEFSKKLFLFLKTFLDLSHHTNFLGKFFFPNPSPENTKVTSTLIVISLFFFLLCIKNRFYKYINILPL